MRTRCDAIVIGTGPGGPSLADRLSAAGQRVVIVESDPIGGLCNATGGATTGSLAASARMARTARRAAEFGIQLAQPVRVDLARVTARAREIDRESERGLRAWLEGMPDVELASGRARFTGPSSIEVAGRAIEAPQIFVNVGARARLPEVPGLAQIDFHTPATLTGLAVLPRHLIILDGGGSGVEFAQMFRRLGSAVTLVDSAPRLLAGEDRDLSASVQELLEAEGVHVRCEAECIRLAATRTGLTIATTCRGGSRSLEGTHLLVAAGAVPDTDSLDLAEAGVLVDARGAIVVDDELRSTTPGIWALGDCHDRAPSPHSARSDAELLAANLLDGESRRASERVACRRWVLDPPLARVGLTEDEARGSGREVLVGRWPMSNVSRARQECATHGFIKLLVDARSEELLGATVFGLGGDEVVQGLLPLMYSRTPYSLLSRSISHIRSTVSERLPATLQNLIPLESTP